MKKINDANNQGFFLAAVNGDDKTVEALIPDVDIGWKNEEGASVMYIAAQQGNAKIIRLLLDAMQGDIAEQKKANINTQTRYGKTPLHEAAREGHIHIVELLLEERADINAKDQYGWAPVHEACFKGSESLNLETRKRYIQIIKILLIHGADIDTSLSNIPKQQLFKWLVAMNNVVVFNYLIGAGFNIRPGYLSFYLHEEELKTSILENRVRLKTELEWIAESVIKTKKMWRILQALPYIVRALQETKQEEIKKRTRGHDLNTEKCKFPTEVLDLIMEELSHANSIAKLAEARGLNLTLVQTIYEKLRFQDERTWRFYKHGRLEAFVETSMDDRPAATNSRVLT